MDTFTVWNCLTQKKIWVHVSISASLARWISTVQNCLLKKFFWPLKRAGVCFDLSCPASGLTSSFPAQPRMIPSEPLALTSGEVNHGGYLCPAEANPRTGLFPHKKQKNHNPALGLQKLQLWCSGALKWPLPKSNESVSSQGRTAQRTLNCWPCKDKASFQNCF